VSLAILHHPGGSVENASRPTLADFVNYLPRVKELHLSQDELAAVPVHLKPPDSDEFLELGELPPGAPRVGNGFAPTVGARQLYAYHSEVPPHIWQHLVVGLAPAQPSGTGGTGMFGIPEERVVDEEHPEQGWRELDAGARPPGLA
jgi:hypothetical protein